MAKIILCMVVFGFGICSCSLLKQQTQERARSFAVVPQRQSAPLIVTPKHVPKPSPTPICKNENQIWINGELTQKGHLFVYSTERLLPIDELFIKNESIALLKCPKNAGVSCRWAEFTTCLTAEDFEVRIKGTRYWFSGFGLEGRKEYLCSQ